MEALPPIVLSMNVHCSSCAKMIRRSTVRAFGAHGVSASPTMGMVVVHGGEHLDPWTLKYYLQRLGEVRHSRHGGGESMKMRRVTVVSDGGRPQRSHFEGIVHMAPEPPYAPYQYPPPPPPPSYAPYPYQPPPPPPPAYYRPGLRWF